MKNTIEIVLIGYFHGFGGAEKSLVMLANALVRSGNTVTLISLNDNKLVYELDEKIKFIFIQDRQGNQIYKQLYRFLNLKKSLKNINPDLVISFWLQPAIFSSIIAKNYKFKTIFSERGDPNDEQYHGILDLFRTIFFKTINGFVFQTHGAKAFFSKSIQDRSKVINNPVYIKYDDFPIPITRKKTIVNVGRLHKQKNQKLLIEAFSRINGLFPDYILEIFGDGELKEDLERQINKLDLNDKVILKGTTKNLFHEIYDASIFVLSSDYEGMPNALMEAMALGIPSISTDCKPGGAKELIKHGENGWIVPTGSAEKLADAMIYLLKHQNIAKRLGINAKEICVTHSVEIIFKMWEDYSRKIYET